MAYMAFKAFKGQVFFHKIKLWVKSTLRFKFGVIMLNGCRENLSKGRKLMLRLLAFEKRFSKNVFKFLQDFTSGFGICNKKFGQRPKGQFHGLFAAFLAFKSQILKHSVVDSILPSLWFWFCFSKWHNLENNFWVANYATGLRSAMWVVPFSKSQSHIG